MTQASCPYPASFGKRKGLLMVVGRSETSGIERTLSSPVPCQMLGLLDPHILFERILHFKLYLVIWGFGGVRREVWAMTQMGGVREQPCRGQFSTSTTWVPGIELRSSDLASSTFKY